MILPRGITGFDAPQRSKWPDQKAFRSDCWAAVTPSRGRVDGRPQVFEGSPTSFVTRVLVLPKGEVSVLLNAFHPWVGFCKPLEPGHCRPEFLDPGRVADRFAATGRYRVFEAREWEQAVTAEMCVELGRGERGQLKYWGSFGGPMRVGDVVFNFWD